MGGRLSSGAFPVIKSFFLFLKVDFVFSIKTFLQAGGIIEPTIHITEPPACEKVYFHRPIAQAVRQSACRKRLRTACIVPLCTGGKQVHG